MTTKRIADGQLPIVDTGYRLSAVGHRAVRTTLMTISRWEGRSGNRSLGKSSRSAGYLLLEVILGLAILGIIVTLVFRIIQTSVRITTDVQYLQSEQEHADGLYELLRKHFDSLPRTAQFRTRRARNALELVFVGAPFHFSWTPNGPQFGSTVIAAQRGSDGFYTLEVVQEPEDASASYAVSGDPAIARWAPIVGNLRECSWRFFDPRTQEWKNDWKDPGARPTLFECTFEASGQVGPTRAVFRWPVASNQQ
jgi:hypothetical protein